MRLGTAWFVIILVLLSIRVVQGFRLSSRLISRATVRRGSFRPLADGSDFDFESDEVFAVTDPMERLKVRHTSFENNIKVRHTLLEIMMMAVLTDQKATNERLKGIETSISGINERLDAWNTMQNATNERLSSIDKVERLSSIDKVERFSSDTGRAAMQEASDNRDKVQMVAAAAFFAWVPVAPKVFEVLLASVPHATQ